MNEVFTTQADLRAVTACDGTLTLKHTEDSRVICRVYTSGTKTISMTYAFKGTKRRLPLGDGTKLAQALDQYEVVLMELKAGHEPGGVDVSSAVRPQPPDVSTASHSVDP